jgi:kynureninase
MFHYPTHEGQSIAYFCGHSLGLQPLATKQYLDLELHKWATQGVEGHFESPNPWIDYHRFSKKGLAQITCAMEDEVVAYGSLSSNLHFLLASFYNPTQERHKILTEDTNFPSDSFAMETHVRHRGFLPNESFVWLKHDQNYCYSTDYILSEIEKHKDELALVMLSGVNFMSGQVLDMKAIAQLAIRYNIKIGLDLAHAVGNVPLNLHDWGVDFAVWCSYKYLNAGPGAVGGYFVHKRNFPKSESHNPQPTIHNILAGWWGHDQKTRFSIGQKFSPVPNADAWQHSNANVLSHAALRASLDVYLTTTMEELYQKSLHNTAVLYDRLMLQKSIEILTPKEQRGNMISMRIKKEGKMVLEYLKNHQVWVDWREPDILRASFCPLYNGAEEWKELVTLLGEV